jgi:hypothetical protein
MFAELAAVEATDPVETQVAEVTGALGAFADAAAGLDPPDERAEEQLELVTVAERGAASIAAAAPGDVAATAAEVGSEFTGRGDRMGIEACTGRTAPAEAPPGADGPDTPAASPDTATFASSADAACTEVRSRYSDTLASLAADPVAATPGLHEYVIATRDALAATPGAGSGAPAALVAALDSMSQVTAAMLEAIAADDGTRFAELATSAFPAAAAEVDTAAQSSGAAGCGGF